MREWLLKFILLLVIKDLYISGDLHAYIALPETSGREEGKADMFAIVSTYRAKVGEEDAIVALHEDWERRKQGPKGYLSWQLFRNIQASRDFIAIVQFENEESARAATIDLKRDAWYDRLISLTEGEAIHTDYMKVWQSQ